MANELKYHEAFHHRSGTRRRRWRARLLSPTAQFGIYALIAIASGVALAIVY
jgi:hypothetical protein